MGLDTATFGKRFRKSFAFSFRNYGKSLAILALLGVFTVLIMQPIAFVFSIHEGYNDQPMVKDLLDMLAEFTKRIAREFTTDYIYISNLVRQFFYLLFILGIVPLIAITTGFSYYSELEKNEAKGLRNAFQKFGKRNRYQEKPEDFE
jgi:hypothetical protein